MQKFNFSKSSTSKSERKVLNARHIECTLHIASYELSIRDGVVRFLTSYISTNVLIMYVLGCLTIPYIEVGLSDHPVYIRYPFAETIPFVRSVITYRWGINVNFFRPSFPSHGQCYSRRTIVAVPSVEEEQKDVFHFVVSVDGVHVMM